MKKVILPLALLVMLSTSCTKENISRLEDVVNNGADDHGGGSAGGGGDNISSSQVPEAVLNAFNEKYPGAAVSEWKKLDNGNYKVEFSFNGDKWESTFSATGGLLKEERD